MTASELSALPETLLKMWMWSVLDDQGTRAAIDSINERALLGSDNQVVVDELSQLSRAVALHGDLSEHAKGDCRWQPAAAELKMLCWLDCEAQRAVQPETSRSGNQR